MPGVGGSRGSAHSESSREGLSGLGHAAGSGASGVSLPAGVLGDRCRVRRLPGQLSLAGLATHSGASGRLAAHSELPGTRGAFGGIRSKYHSRGSRRTRVLPGGLRRTRSLPVTRGAFAGFRVLSLAGLHGALGDRWHVPKVFPKGVRNGLFRRRLPGWLSGQVSYSEGFRRRFRRSFEKGIRQGFGTAPKGVSGHAALSEGLRKGASARLEEGLRRRVVPKGFSKGGGSEGVFEGGFAEGLPEGDSERLRRGREGVRKVSGTVSLKEICEGVFRKASIGGGSGRWIEDLRSRSRWSVRTGRMDRPL